MHELAACISTSLATTTTTTKKQKKLAFAFTSEIAPIMLYPTVIEGPQRVNDIKNISVITKEIL